MSEIFSKILKDKNGKTLNVGSKYQQPEWGAEEVDILPEQEVTFSAQEAIGGMGGALVTFATALITGETYIVNYNGTAYAVTFNGFYMGNGVLTGADDTGEPFMILSGDGVNVIVPVSQEAVTATVSIKGNEIKPIESKYAPEIPFIDLVDLGLPDVTNDSSQTLSYDSLWFQINIEPLLKNGIAKFRLGASIKHTNMYSTTGTEITSAFTFDIVAHAGNVATSENYNYDFFSMYHDAIIYIVFTLNDVQVTIRRIKSLMYATT